MRLRQLLVLSSLPLLNLVGGCASTHSSASNNDSSPLYRVAVDSTPFYTHGPRQGAPDQRIPRDTMLRLVRYSPSFSKVALLEGPTGYVLTDDITPSRQPLAETRRSIAIAAAEPPPAEPERPAPLSEPPLPEVEPTAPPAQTDSH